MIRSLRTAEQAMQMEQVRIDALANNLANATSTGFRQILTRVAEAQQDEAGGQVRARVQTSRDWVPVPQLDMRQAMDPRPGALSETGRQTDVAIMGRGFFAVSTDSGERYTRNGSFQLDAQGRLVTAAGDPVLGDGGPLTIEGKEFSIEPDGSVVVDGNVAGRLKIVDFTDPTRLEHEGENLLVAPTGLEAQAVPTSELALAQGQLEGSNVNPIDTLVAMIAAQRAFEVHAKVMSTEDEILSKTVNNLPRVSG